MDISDDSPSNAAYAAILAEFKDIRENIIELVSTAQRTAATLAEPSPNSKEAEQLAQEYTRTLERLKTQLMDQLVKLEDGATMRPHKAVNDIDAAVLAILNEDA
eukprot:TRINITY_DN5733_c0_g1_i2.p3 TRINITY_DN5733_c0_g1~~TRINITY_DN5733_c0_g1_i2.p3  ORF type:complete len:104 (+),score=31.80 TRINITY_DN5733_c0_g1_i2:82-393(+)